MHLIISTTSNCSKTLETIKEKILQNNLSPCIQTYKNIFSDYIWKSKIEEAKEIKIDIKTHVSLKGKIVEIIKEHHNYECPEIILQKIELVNGEYSEWFNKILNI